MPNAARQTSPAQTFKGFDDYVEVFAAGEQTDSAGNTRSFTEADLDKIVANHNPEHPAPAVLGHPKHDDPAYGWVESLKRDGKKLLAKFSQVVPAFETAVKEGRFRNRSIKLLETDKGLALGHVGFLGAALPAVSGLKPMAFNDGAAGVTYEFSMPAPSAWHIGAMARMGRRLREWLISKHGIETADQVAPEYDIGALEEMESAARNDSSQRIAAFNQQEPAVPDPTKPAATFTQADLDAVRAEEAAKQKPAADELAQLRFAQRLAVAQSDVKAHVDAGRLSPALAVGAAEFLADLRAQPVEFEFSAEGKTDKKDRAAWFTAFLAAMPQIIKPGQTQAGAGSDPGPALTDATQIAAKAAEYQAEQAKAGITINIAEAVAHVSAQHGKAKQ